MLGSFNTTFLVLIPKVDKGDSFGDLRPISLCNYMYKIISKVVAIRLKKFLSKVISAKQFSFLEAIGTAQEALHSIK